MAALDFQFKEANRVMADNCKQVSVFINGGCFSSGTDGCHVYEITTLRPRRGKKAICMGGVCRAEGNWQPASWKGELCKHTVLPLKAAAPG